MELVSPGIGLIFWMTLAFLAVLFILGKYAWKPIMKALKEREMSISDALNAAELAKEEMKMLQFSNEKLMKEARNERDILLAETRKIKDSILEEARLKSERRSQQDHQQCKRKYPFRENGCHDGIEKPVGRSITGNRKKNITKRIIRSAETGNLCKRTIG